MRVLQYRGDNLIIHPCNTGMRVCWWQHYHPCFIALHWYHDQRDNGLVTILSINGMRVSQYAGAKLLSKIGNAGMRVLTYASGNIIIRA